VFYRCAAHLEAKREEMRRRTAQHKAESERIQKQISRLKVASLQLFFPSGSLVGRDRLHLVVLSEHKPQVLSPVGSSRKAVP